MNTTRLELKDKPVLGGDSDMKDWENIEFSNSSVILMGGTEIGLEGEYDVFVSFKGSVLMSQDGLIFSS